MPPEARLRPILTAARLLRFNQRRPPMPVLREQLARGSRSMSWLAMRPGPKPESVTDHLVDVEGGRIIVRLYRPSNAGTEPLSMYVFLHGGGWCIGSVEERDPRCRAVAAGARCIVASVDYRLAPENQFPTGPEDCYAALCWLVDESARLGIDPERVAIGGESAGANLAAVVCLMCRDRRGPRLVHQWLDVPATDATCSQSGFTEVPDGYLLDADFIEDFYDNYLPDRSLRTHPYVSPLLADDHAGLPGAWIMSAEFDHLRGDATAYAEALERAGVTVHHERLAGHVHSSPDLTRLLPTSYAYEQRAIAALAEAFERAATTDGG